jgi:hypothetical protein
MYHRASYIDLPQHEEMQWYQLVNTASQNPEQDIVSYEKRKLLRIQDRHYCPARSVSILIGGLCTL